MKKTIISYTLLGLIPFYLFKFKTYLSYTWIPIYEFHTIFYGALIVSFLSGMHWEILIKKQQSSKLVLFLPMLPVIFCWSLLFSNMFQQKYVIIIGLIYCFVMDYLFNTKSKEKWYLNLRFFVTLLAIISFVV